MDELLADKKLLLRKHPGKGGWTYLEVPGISRLKRRAFGWVMVKGSVDGYTLRNFRLWPMKNGSMFMPVKAEIRKRIEKNEGDSVHVVLYLDEGPVEIPPDLKACLNDEPLTGKRFQALEQEEQNRICRWLMNSTSDKISVQRMAYIIDSLLNNRKLKLK